MTGKNREVEALRAVAIALVLAQHVPLAFPTSAWPAALKWVYEHIAFWSGVDLFFVISGFVVTASLLRGFDGAAAAGRSRWAEARRFWVRRAFRLFPLAWLWVGLALLATLAFNRSGAFGSLESNAKQAALIVFYVYNFFAQSLFASGENIATLGVYWSLATEEQFYLVLPVLLLLLKPRALFAVLALAIAVQFFLWRPAPWIEPLWGLRCEGLAWGVLLAFFASRRSAASVASAASLGAPLAWAANLALLGLIVALPWAAFQVRVTTGVVAVACLAWVWLAMRERGDVLPGLALRAPVQWLGSRSYALYVAHVPSYLAVREAAVRLAGGEPLAVWWPLALVMSLLLACIAAEVSHRFVERPLREKGRRIAAGMA